MKPSTLLWGRHATRLFKKEPIPLDLLKNCVAAAAMAPSSKNTQPWKVHLLSGKTLSNLRSDYLKAFDEKQSISPPYKYSIDPLPEDWLKLAREVGFSLFDHKNIKRNDKEKRRVHNRENFAFFNAPHLLLVCTKKTAERGNFFDCGIFLGSLLLVLEENQIASCPQFTATSFPQILAKHIPDLKNQICITGLALGYAQKNHVNEFRSNRLPQEHVLKTYT